MKPSAGWCLWLIVGCVGDARLELAASDALLAVANQMGSTIQEYHDEVVGYDDSRESAVVSAFVDRVQNDPTNQAAIDSHTSDFKMALRKIRADRQTEWGRRSAAMENVSVLREVAKGLQKVAMDSLTLNDEMRRYLNGWMESAQRANASASDTQWLGR